MTDIFIPLQKPFEMYSINKEGKLKNKYNKFMKKWMSRGYFNYTLYNKNLETPKKNFSLHRLLAIAFVKNHYNFPVVDHIDRNSTNNIISNLRWTTIQENNINRRIRNPLGFIGIRKRSNKYESTLSRDRIKIYLGRFNTIEEAVEIRRQAIIKYNDNKYKNKI